MSGDSALRQWSQQHDGYDVDRSRLVRAWLRAMHVVAAPLARAGVPPTALTVLGVGAAGAAVGIATRAPLAATLVAATAACDGLDGAVALQRAARGQRTNAHGTAIDHAADRITDVLFVVALARAGASSRAAVGAAVTTVGYETARSLLRRRQPVGAVVTVGERPIRVVVVCAGLATAPSAGAATLVVLTTCATAQLARAAAART